MSVREAPIRVVLADDHALVREGTAELLERCKERGLLLPVGVPEGHARGRWQVTVWHVCGTPR